MKKKHYLKSAVGLGLLMILFIPFSLSADSEEEGEKAFVGVVTERLSGAIGAHLGIPKGIGLTVERVVKGSSAEEYGIEKYDILLEMDGQLLTSVSHFTVLLSHKKAGDETVFKLLRKGKEMEVKVVLGSRSSTKSNAMNIDQRIEMFHEHLEAIAGNEDVLKYIPSSEQIEETVRSALAQARYHIETATGDSDRMSIVHTGSAKTIVTTDEGTLIVEALKNEDLLDDRNLSRVVAIGNDGEVAFSGELEIGGDLPNPIPDWVARRLNNLSQNQIKVIVREDEMKVTTEEAIPGEDEA